MKEMENSDTLRDRQVHPKGPNFGMVVISAGIALIVIFIIALIVLAIRGRRDIPLNHNHKDRNALVREMPSGSIEASVLCQSAALPAQVISAAYQV